MFEKKFLEATGERALKTFFQTLLALLGTDAVGVLSVDILASLQVAGAAALLSVLSSFASSNVGKTGPSLVGESTETLILVQEPKKAAAKKTTTKKTTK